MHFRQLLGLKKSEIRVNRKSNPVKHVVTQVKMKSGWNNMTDNTKYTIGMECKRAALLRLAVKEKPKEFRSWVEKKLHTVHTKHAGENVKRPRNFRTIDDS